MSYRLPPHNVPPFLGVGSRILVWFMCFLALMLCLMVFGGHIPLPEFLNAPPSRPIILLGGAAVVAYFFSNWMVNQRNEEHYRITQLNEIRSQVNNDSTKKQRLEKILNTFGDDPEYNFAIKSHPNWTRDKD